MHKFHHKIVMALGSIKTAVCILTLIILACAIGTFIPRGDIYHSGWFIGLLGLLWCSIFICTIKRPKLRPQAFSTVITHLGLLVILLGALVTGIFGERGFMLIYEKHNQDTFIYAGDKFKTLDFKIHLDDFSIDYYDEANKPQRFVKNFSSRVTVIEQDKEILKDTIKVNHPLKYKGYSFYQSGYDQKNFKWTGLDVVRDPGEPFVWCGFILLNCGVILSFYRRAKAIK